MSLLYCFLIFQLSTTNTSSIPLNSGVAMKNNLFISEDGSVIEIHDDATEKKRRGKSPQKKNEKTKLVACGECEGCLKKACKKCDKCKRKKRCSLRTCSNIRRVAISEDDDKKSKRDKDESDDEESDVAKESKTPRIRIRVSSSKKRKATPSQDEDTDEEPESGGSQNESSRKRARLSNGRRRSRSPVASEDEQEEDYDEMFDIKSLEAKQKDLKEASFSEARDNLIQNGPWHLPTNLESNDASFKEVAKITLINISRYDTYEIFKEPVSEEDAPGYSDVIKNPMDFGTMKSKVEKGKYGKGSNAAAK